MHQTLGSIPLPFKKKKVGHDLHRFLWLEMLKNKNKNKNKTG
jgi:hypothetical protein